VHDLRRRRLGRLAGLGHRLQDGVHGTQFVGVAVERDDVGATPIRLEGVPAGPASHVDHLGGRPDPEPVEIYRQHRAIARS
jgi:hypothetical protein